jgi:ferredoxin
LARIWGIDPLRVFTLTAARDLGLLPAIARIEVIGPAPEALRPRPAWRLARPVPLRGFGGPAWLNAAVERLMRLEPRAVDAKCTGCGECGEVCAAGAIALERDGTREGRRVVINCERCIACFCCQEMCPQGAIEVSAGLAARLFGLGTR